MQKHFFTILFLSVALSSYSQDKAAATVEQQQGLLIFNQAKPVAPYEYLGTVKAGVTFSGKPSELLNKLLKNAAKEFPKGEALIILSTDMDKADIIKFK